MQTSKIVPVKVRINSISEDRFGQLVVVAQPNEHNKTGNYIMNAAQEAFLLRSCKLPNRMALAHLVEFSNGTCTFEYTAQFNKNGQAWDNGKEGAAHKSGVFTKDWTQFSGYKVTLGATVKLLLATSIATAIATMPVAAPQPVAARVTSNGPEEEVEETEESDPAVDPADPAKDETPTV